MRSCTPEARSRSDTISARRDPLRLAIWGASVAATITAAALEPRRVRTALRGTAGPFATLAVVIMAGALFDRMGLFRILARLLIPDRASPRVSFGAVLAFTALLSALINLDVAVVVAMPIALRVAPRKGLAATWLTAAVAVTANATSFLLPTSNLTNLLILNRSPLPVWTYLRQGWAAWSLVTVLTVAGLAVLLGHQRDGGPWRRVEPKVSIHAVFDLAPLYVGASAIRALLGTGLIMHGGFADQAGLGAMLAAGVNNLPAAAAIHAVGPAGRWAAILSMAIGPNLLITGSMATLICRRIARDGGVALDAARFSLLGLTVVPLQLLMAEAGLRGAGVHL